MNLKGNRPLQIALVFIGTLVLATQMRFEHGALGGVLTLIALWLMVGVILAFDHRQKQRRQNRS